MSAFKEAVLAVPAMLLALLLSDALLGPDRHDQTAPSVAISTSWIGADPPPAERWLAKQSIVTGGLQVDASRPAGINQTARNVSPGARIRGVFAQFVPGESDRTIRTFADKPAPSGRSGTLVNNS